MLGEVRGNEYQDNLLAAYRAFQKAKEKTFALWYKSYVSKMRNWTS